MERDDIEDKIKLMLMMMRFLYGVKEEIRKRNGLGQITGVSDDTRDLADYPTTRNKPRKAGLLTAIQQQHGDKAELSQLADAVRKSRNKWAHFDHKRANHRTACNDLATLIMFVQALDQVQALNQVAERGVDFIEKMARAENALAIDLKNPAIRDIAQYAEEYGDKGYYERRWEKEMAYHTHILRCLTRIVLGDMEDKQPGEGIRMQYPPENDFEKAVCHLARFRGESAFQSYRDDYRAFYTAILVEKSRYPVGFWKEPTGDWYLSRGEDFETLFNRAKRVTEKILFDCLDIQKYFFVKEDDRRAVCPGLVLLFTSWIRKEKCPGAFFYGLKMHRSEKDEPRKDEYVLTHFTQTEALTEDTMNTLKDMPPDLLEKEFTPCDYLF